MTIKKGQIMKMIAISFFSTLASLLVLDSLWLGMMYKRLYQPNLAHLLSDTINYTPAVIFYLLYSLAVTFFIVVPAIENKQSYADIIFMGLFFGAITYGTYDLTNQATLRNWPVLVTVADITWGALMVAVTSAIAVLITKRIA